MNHSDPTRPKGKPHPRLRRGMYLLPSLFTAGSMGAGYFSIFETIKAIGDSGNSAFHLDWAAIAILFAIPFDGLDGRIARITNTATDFGKELDSLADVITFGVAPSLLAFVWGFHFLPDSMNPAAAARTSSRPVRLSASCFCSAGLRGWRASTSATTHSRETRAGLTGNISWACRFLPRPGWLRQACIFAMAFPIPTGTLRFRGSSSSGSRAS